MFVQTAGGALLNVAAGSLLGCRVDHEMHSMMDGGAAAQNLPFLTPVDDFYRAFGGRNTIDGWTMPQINSAKFTMKIDGLVSTPTEISLADLQSDTQNHVTTLNTMMCVLGYRSTAIWKGVPLRVLLDRSGVDRKRAVRMRVLGADGFENNLRINDIEQSPDDIIEPLVVFQIYDQPLPVELGFPFRLMLSDRYGYKCVKWIERIEITDIDEPTGQYQERGYSDEGVIEPVATVENHPVSTHLPAGRVQLAGIALSGYAGVDAVEVALDGSAYERATLTQRDKVFRAYPELTTTRQLAESARFMWPFRGVWILWNHAFELSPGEHSVGLRVRDKAGQVGDATSLRLTAVG